MQVLILIHTELPFNCSGSARSCPAMERVIQILSETQKTQSLALEFPLHGGASSSEP